MYALLNKHFSKNKIQISPMRFSKDLQFSLFFHYKSMAIYSAITQALSHYLTTSNPPSAVQDLMIGATSRSRQTMNIQGHSIERTTHSDYFALYLL